MSSTDFTLDSSLRVGFTDEASESNYEFKPKAQSSPLRPDLLQNVALHNWVQEYRTTVSSLEQEIAKYQADYKDLKVQVIQLIEENQRLTHELQQHVQKSLLPSDGKNKYLDQLETVKRQLAATNDAKDSALQMWNMALQEIERLERVIQNYQKGTDLSLLEAKASEIQKEFGQALQLVQAEADRAKRDFLKSSEEVDSLKRERATLANSNKELAQKINEQENSCKSHVVKIQTLQSELLIKEASLTELSGKLQKQEDELKDFSQSNNNLRKKLLRLQTENEDLHEREENSLRQAKESIQLVEEALLEKDAAIFKEQEAEKELNNLQKSLDRLTDTAAEKTKQAVEVVRKKLNLDISRLGEEIGSLQVVNSELECQLDGLLREKRSLLSECARLKEDWIKTEGGGDLFRSVCQKLSQAEQQREVFRLKVDSLSVELKDVKQSLLGEKDLLDSECERLRSTVVEFKRKLESSNRERNNVQQQKELLQQQVQAHTVQDANVQAQLRQQVSLLEQKLHDQSLEHQRRLMSENQSHSTSLQELTSLLSAQKRLGNKWKTEAEQLAERCEKELRDSARHASELKAQNVELNASLLKAQESLGKAEQIRASISDEKEQLQKRLSLCQQLYQANLTS